MDLKQVDKLLELFGEGKTAKHDQQHINPKKNPKKYKQTKRRKKKKEKKRKKERKRNTHAIQQNNKTTITKTTTITITKDKNYIFLLTTSWRTNVCCWNVWEFMKGVARLHWQHLKKKETYNAWTHSVLRIL